MKKILLFIMLNIFTLQSYTITQETKENNQIGEKLKIDIKFTIPKEIVKYIVFASDDQGNTMKDTLELPDFILSQDINKSGFIATPPTVYTKRIINNKIEELSASDKVTYVLTHEDGFFPIVLNDTLGSSGQNSFRIIMNYLPKIVLEDIANMLGSGYTVSPGGNLKKGNLVYSPAKQIHMYNYKGVLTTESIDSKGVNSFSQEDIKKIETYVAEKNGLDITNVYLEVKLES